MSEDAVAPGRLAVADAIRADVRRGVESDSWCHVLVPPAPREWARMFLDNPLYCRRLRGRPMRTREGLENEVSAELAFPEYDEDRPALSFDVFLITDHDREPGLRRRWRDARAPLEP